MKASQAKQASLNVAQAKESVAEALQNTPAAFGYIFGSVARGTADVHSDVDIAISLPGGTDTETLVGQIIERIAINLNIPIERVDIKVFEELPLTLQYRVLRDGLLVYIKNVPYHRHIAVKTLSKYADEQPFFARAEEGFLKRHAAITL